LGTRAKTGIPLPHQHHMMETKKLKLVPFMMMAAEGSVLLRQPVVHQPVLFDPTWPLRASLAHEDETDNAVAKRQRRQRRR
jgi:hypothetical protein